MKFETLYLKGNRCHNDLIKRVTDIIDIYLMEKPPEYNLACASCKFVNSLKKEKYFPFISYDHYTKKNQLTFNYVKV